MESNGREWWWRVMVESGGGEWWWRVAVGSGGGEWRWGLVVESGGGKCCLVGRWCLGVLPDGAVGSSNAELW